MKALFLAALLFSSTPAISAETSKSAWQVKIINIVRPYVEEYLGTEQANEWFGEVLDSLDIPSIPKISDSAIAIREFPEEQGKKELSAKQMSAWNAKYVKELFVNVNRTKPREDQVLSRLNTLNQGASREGVFYGLVRGEGYRNSKEEMDVPSQKSMLEFAHSFAIRFLAKKVTMEKLKNFNEFRLKRILIADSMKVIDEYLYAGKPELADDWYGAFSGEIAREYEGLFTEGVRANKQMLDHKAWANSMSYDIVKSEVAIKLGRVLTFLNQVP